VVVAGSVPSGSGTAGSAPSGVGGLTVPSAVAVATSTPGGQLPTGALSESGGSAPAGGASASVTGAGPPGATGALPRPTAAPTDHGPIQVGFQVTSDLQAGFAATGASGSAPDETPMVQALERWVNSTGGIDGRRLDVVIHHTAVTRGSFSDQAEEACTDFLQDHHVLIVASSPVDASDDLTNCVAGHHVPIVVQDLWPYDDAYYRKYPDLLYSPGRASPDRWAQPVVDTLRSGGYFTAGAKVGLVRFDAPVYARMGDRLNSALTRRGLSFTKVVAIGTPGSLSDFGAMSAAISNAIVQFRSAGVDHLMFAASGELPFFFMTDAESQHYRPRYGLTTNDVPSTQVTRGVPPAQFAGALAAGWQPANDSGDPNAHVHNAAWTLCNHIMHKYGVATNGFFTDSHCDSMFFIRRALAALPVFSAAGMAQVVARFGTSYESPLTFATAFGPARFDGAHELRLAAYQTGCGCFAYTGPLRPM